jgi:hypothetical protein
MGHWSDKDGRWVSDDEEWELQKHVWLPKPKLEPIEKVSAGHRIPLEAKKRGGKTAAALMSKEERQARARKAAQARWSKP